MLTRYNGNGSNGRNVRFDSAACRNGNGNSYLKYSTNHLSRDRPLAGYSNGLDNPYSNGYSKDPLNGFGKYSKTSLSNLDPYSKRSSHGSDQYSKGSLFGMNGYSKGSDNGHNKNYSDRGYSNGGYQKGEYRDNSLHENGKYDSRVADIQRHNYNDLSYRKLPNADLYRNPSFGTDMEPRLARGILKKNQSFLRRHLVLSRSVLDKLVQFGLIGDVMKKRLLGMEADDQVPELIRLLDDRGLGTLRKFVNVLRETGSKWIADVLLDTDALEYEELRHEEGFDPRDHYENRLVRYNHGALKRYDSADDIPSRTRRSNYGSYSARAPSPDARRRNSPRVSLNDLLSSKRNPESDIRGRIRPGFFLSGGQMHHKGREVEQIPRVLGNLEDHFRNQTENNEVALSSLKQEEMAIRELMDQNRREQQKVRKNQYTLMDIGQKLKDVHVRTSEIYDPAANAAVSTYRLSQLNQIPWASCRY